MWLSFAPIANYTAAFYGIAVGTVDWFSLAYFAVSPVVGIAAIFLLDTCGLKIPVRPIRYLWRQGVYIIKLMLHAYTQFTCVSSNKVYMQPLQSNDGARCHTFPTAWIWPHLGLAVNSPWLELGGPFKYHHETFGFII